MRGGRGASCKTQSSLLSFQFTSQENAKARPVEPRANEDSGPDTTAVLVSRAKKRSSVEENTEFERWNNSWTQCTFQMPLQQYVREQASARGWSTSDMRSIKTKVLIEAMQSYILPLRPQNEEDCDVHHWNVIIRVSFQYFIITPDPRLTWHVFGGLHGP